MLTTGRVCFVGLVFLIIQNHALSQATPKTEVETIWLGAELRLGMSQSEVEKKLEGTAYRLDDRNDDSAVIRKKTDTSPRGIIGAVVFKNGNLTFVSKQWGSFRDSGTREMGNILVSLIAKANEEGKFLAAVKSKPVILEPGITANEIEIDFRNNKKIHISVSETRDTGHIVSIDEIVERK